MERSLTLKRTRSCNLSGMAFRFMVAFRHSSFVRVLYFKFGEVFGIWSGFVLGLCYGWFESSCCVALFAIIIQFWDAFMADWKTVVVLLV